MSALFVGSGVFLQKIRLMLVASGPKPSALNATEVEQAKNDGSMKFALHLVQSLYP